METTSRATVNASVEDAEGSTTVAAAFSFLSHFFLLIPALVLNSHLLDAQREELEKKISKDTNSHTTHVEQYVASGNIVTEKKTMYIYTLEESTLKQLTTLQASRGDGSSQRSEDLSKISHGRKHDGKAQTGSRYTAKNDDD